MVSLSTVRERLAAEDTSTASLSELAALVGVSRYQLLRAFTRGHGLPPHAWLRSLRAERARALIARGSALGETALQCGFADQSHMNRIFIRHFGYTPGGWRRASRHPLQ
jgi:AraC-like DNA-binding protein